MCSAAFFSLSLFITTRGRGSYRSGREYPSALHAFPRSAHCLHTSCTPMCIIRPHKLFFFRLYVKRVHKSVYDDDDDFVIPLAVYIYIYLQCFRYYLFIFFKYFLGPFIEPLYFLCTLRRLSPSQFRSNPSSHVFFPIRSSASLPRTKATPLTLSR